LSDETKRSAYDRHLVEEREKASNRPKANRSNAFDTNGHANGVNGGDDWQSFGDIFGGHHRAHSEALNAAHNASHASNSRRHGAASSNRFFDAALDDDLADMFGFGSFNMDSANRMFASFFGGDDPFAELQRTTTTSGSNGTFTTYTTSSPMGYSTFSFSSSSGGSPHDNIMSAHTQMMNSMMGAMMGGGLLGSFGMMGMGSSMMGLGAWPQQLKLQSHHHNNNKSQQSHHDALHGNMADRHRRSHQHNQQQQQQQNLGKAATRDLPDAVSPASSSSRHSSHIDLTNNDADVAPPSITPDTSTSPTSPTTPMDSRDDIWDWNRPDVDGKSPALHSRRSSGHLSNHGYVIFLVIISNVSDHFLIDIL
jgi:hypothetical protein